MIYDKAFQCDSRVARICLRHTLFPVLVVVLSIMIRFTRDSAILKIDRCDMNWKPNFIYYAFKFCFNIPFVLIFMIMYIFTLTAKKSVQSSDSHYWGSPILMICFTIAINSSILLYYKNILFLVAWWYRYKISRRVLKFEILIFFCSWQGILVHMLYNTQAGNMMYIWCQKLKQLIIYFSGKSV